LILLTGIIGADRRVFSKGTEGVSALERSGELLQYYCGVGHQGLEELLRRPDVVGGPAVRRGRASLRYASVSSVGN
jgi:hypothetical protein